MLKNTKRVNTLRYNMRVITILNSQRVITLQNSRRVIKDIVHNSALIRIGKTRKALETKIIGYVRIYPNEKFSQFFLFICTQKAQNRKFVIFFSSKSRFHLKMGGILFFSFKLFL